jgi:hypothetical protein
MRLIDDLWQTGRADTVTARVLPLHPFRILKGYIKEGDKAMNKLFRAGIRSVYGFIEHTIEN